MTGIRQKLAQIRAQWGRLSMRERRMVSMLLGVGAGVFLLLIGYFVWSSLDDLAEYNHAARRALKEVAEHQEEFLEARSRMASQEVRISPTPLQLPSLLESAAKDAAVEIAETTERTPTPKGKKYIEKGIDLKLRNVDLRGLTQFLKRIETGPNLLVVDRLYMKTRYNEHDKFEIVEVGIMTFERAPAANRAQPGDRT